MLSFTARRRQPGIHDILAQILFRLSLHGIGHWSDFLVVFSCGKVSRISYRIASHLFTFVCVFSQGLASSEITDVFGVRKRVRVVCVLCVPLFVCVTCECVCAY